MFKERKPLKEKVNIKESILSRTKADDTYKILLENRNKRKEVIKVLCNR
ncbi:hypothetical protein [Alkaliphilus pronyensis]|nr:hypothetical protein [Alkaliphilus pronyensis]